VARQRMQQCLTCKAFSLKTVCPQCGETAQAAAPLKWSPEDHRAALRRKMNEVESDAWPSSIPTLPSLAEMESEHREEEE
jgi:rRNA maturation protein Nop10